MWLQQQIILFGMDPANPMLTRDCFVIVRTGCCSLKIGRAACQLVNARPHPLLQPAVRGAGAETFAARVGQGGVVWGWLE